MLKNAYNFMILLLFTSFISKTAAYSVSKAEDTQTENYFAQVIKFVRRDINSKLIKLLPALATLPATITNNFDKIQEFINKFIDIAGEIDEIDLKIHFQLYTPVNPYEKFLLELSQESFHNSKFNSSLETKFLIHGFYESLPPTSIMYDIRDQLFQQGNYNIIVVDWSRYSRNSYDTAAIHAAFVGYEIARLIKVLMHYKGINPESVHLIGHSMGGHAAGYAGKITPFLGRITSLDATGLLFDDLPSCLKITNEDAEFVDAIHTHGTSILTEGLGTMLPYGDIDFYPNGGSVQPGCSFGNVYIDTNKNVKLLNTNLDFIFCNHQRALHLFLESINECWFDSVACNSYSDFKNGKCPRETSLVSRMGFHAKKIEDVSEDTALAFYLETNSEYPFCFENF